MRIIILFLILGIVACRSSNKEEGQKAGNALENPKFDHIALLNTKGLPKGFLQRDYTISSNGKMAFTTVELPNQKRRFLVQLDLVNNVPVLASISGKYNDLEPFIAPGDTILLFSSDRPMFEGDSTRDYNIWQAKIVDLKLEAPQPFDTVINTDRDEFYPSMNQQRDLYFTADYVKGGRDNIYRSSYSDSGYVKPEKLSFCDEDKFEFNAYIFPDDQMILFSSYGRDYEVGGGDLFYSERNEEGEWAEPQILGEKLNTKSLDFSPFVKGDTLFFTSRRQDISWENKPFKYLAEISAHADSATIGVQGIYIVPFSSLIKKQQQQQGEGINESK